MPAIFKHNNKLFQCMNLQKKLKKMKLSEDSIEIVWEGEATQSELEKRFCKLINGTPKEDSNKMGLTYYHYKHINNGHKLVSVEPIEDKQWIFTHTVDY